MIPVLVDISFPFSSLNFRVGCAAPPSSSSTVAYGDMLTNGRLLEELFLHLHFRSLFAHTEVNELGNSAPPFNLKADRKDWFYMHQLCQ
jgi:hypothetical protein